jgi:hypothetical protein
MSKGLTSSHLSGGGVAEMPIEHGKGTILRTGEVGKARRYNIESSVSKFH